MNWKDACRWAVASSIVATVASSVFALPATAAPIPGPKPTVAPEMLAAMQRDLGLTADQALARLDRDRRGATLEQALAPKLGESFAGAWLAPGADRLTVATTDPAKTDQIRSAGAEARVVGYSYRQLDQTKRSLDGLGYAAPKSVPGWHVDIVTNTVTVLTHPNARDAARSFVASAGVNPATVRFVDSDLAPRPLYDVRGGDQYGINNQSLCSVGFSVNGGFVTAGHCGTVGSSTVGSNGVAQGTFQISSFPGNDYAFVATNSQWTPKAVVNRYDGSTVGVAGSQEAAIGAAVCRSGRTTGWKCGTILGKNESVTYPEGTITGMTRTNACAEPGDSGGSWLAGQQAQGVTSGGSGNCSQGGTIWFYPLGVILARTGKTLITEGGGEPPVGCEGIAAWSATTGYAPGDVVGHAGHKWESTYWSTNAEPGDPRSWAVWKDAGAC
ncbi:serine protease [Actinosynnema sp. ALI-1.44]|uniref:alpha-lytic protease prodomain-containing protein n=1 Tax=Actinosynnema sp. ALI-1.44 TaxID=1933779 RepID=UPI00097BFC97|nr:alpha-lytic protease prodomain-containing protein [Actinosynnema sp. ALI-1.44]ONI90102.1 serine protease [Actinosynnema sp. ALI-1.44]